MVDKHMQHIYARQDEDRAAAAKPLDAAEQRRVLRKLMGLDAGGEDGDGAA
jgi:hypothetical protein